MHSFEVAYLLVSDHGAVAVTDASGAFVLPSPEGTFTLHAWHGEWASKAAPSSKVPSKSKSDGPPKPWERTSSVTVAGSAATKVDLTLP